MVELFLWSMRDPVEVILVVEEFRSLEDLLNGVQIIDAAYNGFGFPDRRLSHPLVTSRHVTAGEMVRLGECDPYPTSPPPTCHVADGPLLPPKWGVRRSTPHITAYPG